MRRLSKVEHEHYDKCRSVWTDFIDSLDANKGLHELKTRKLTIVPLFYKTSSEASGINKLADELFERGDDYLCYLVANSMDDFTSIEQGEVIRRVFNYGEAFFDGMDECWLDISGTESLFGSPEKVANEIRETMKFELGLTISVGVSFNKIFAKLGSDMKKPDAVTVIPKDTFKEKIWGLPAADLLGVGRATQRVLDSYCIRTIGDLANTDPEFLRRRLGKNGVVLWNYANGNDLSLVAKKDFVSPIKSVGHGITTVADLEKPEQVWPVFLELTQDIGHKLRVHGLSAEGVAIHIRDNTLNTRQWQTKIALPTQSPMIIAKTAFQLFEKRYGWNNPIRSVTVQAINLVPQDTPRQIDMFMDAAKQDKLERMEKCVEEIRRRFGKDSIRNGVLCQNLRLPPEKAEITMPTGMVG